MPHGDFQLTEIYDVVIVGAGLSGLSAAYELRDLNILVLEKEERAGGRVLTRSQYGIPYDLGAIFGYKINVLPTEFQTSDLTRESNRIGVFLDGKVHYGNSVQECLAKLGFRAQELKQVEDYCANKTTEVSPLSKNAYNTLNAFFRVIHPEDMRQYLPERRSDALKKFDTRHYQAGNGELIKQFVNQLATKLRLSAEVTSVKEKRDVVDIRFTRNRKQTSVLARAVIIASPATSALKMLKTVNNQCRTFLRSVLYQEGTVVAIGIDKANFTDFSYIVTPSLPFNTVLKHRTKEHHSSVLYVYYMGNESRKLKALTWKQMIQKTIELLRLMNIGPILDENILFSDVKRWPMVGPIISEAAYAGWIEKAVRPSPSVFLCGDYTYVKPVTLLPYSSPGVLPYGMTPAVLSGRETAGKVKNHLYDEGKKLRSKN
jgi:protoporphyrinogen oxidase